MSVNDKATKSHAGVIWHLVRRISLGALAVFLVVILALGVTFWRLTQAPIDITPVTRYWHPWVLTSERDHTVIGTVTWGKVTIGWLPHEEGAPAALRVRLEQVDVHQPNGQSADHVGHAEAILNVPSLWRGVLAVRSLELSDARMTFRRRYDGSIVPDFGGDDVRSSHKQNTAPSSLVEIEALRSLRLHDVAILLRDSQQPSGDMSLSIPQSEIGYQQHVGWEGHVSGLFRWEGKEVPFQVTASPKPVGRTELSVKMSPFVPAQLASWLPGQTDIVRRLHVPMQLSMDGELSPQGMSGRFLTLHTVVQMGRGDIEQVNQEPLHVVEGVAQFNIHWIGPRTFRDVSLDNATAHVVMQDGHHQEIPVDTAIQLHLDDLLKHQNIDVDIHAQIPHFDFSTLGTIWPYHVMKGGRRWITTNMPFGQGENLSIHAHLDSHQGLSGLHVSQLEGDLYGHNLSVFWLRPVQPITGLEAHAHFLDPDRLQIDADHGQLLDQHGGVMVIPHSQTILSGLMKDDQFAHIYVEQEGSLPVFLNILSHPRLHLLSAHPFLLGHPAGTLHAGLTIALPLDNRVTVNDISFDASARYDSVALDFPDLGAVRQGKGLLHVTGTDMHVQGQATLRGVPLQFAVMESFRNNIPGRLLRSVEAQAVLTPSLWHSLGQSSPQGISFSGKVPTHLFYQQKGLGPGHRQSDIRVSLDLTPAAVTSLLWSKALGQAASMTGHVTLRDDRLQSFDDVRAQGPSLSLVGEALLQHHHIIGLSFNQAQIGRNAGRIEVKWPVAVTSQNAYAIDVQAQTLDLVPWLKERSGDKKQPRSSERRGVDSRLPAGNWSISAHAERIFYTPQEALRHVDMNVAWQNQHIHHVRFDMAAPVPVALRLTPMSGGTEHYLEVTIPNIGSVLETCGVESSLSGGVGQLRGIFKAERLPFQSVGWGLGLGIFSGHLDVRDLAIVHPPAVLTMATVFAPLHWGQIKRDRFENVMLSSDLVLQNEVLTLHEGQAHNAVLGGTIEGALNLKTNMLAMKGTVSPLFKLNHAAGALLGMHSKGQGAMAMNYTLEGTLERPDVRAYPFSVLMPDMLRKIFN